MKNSKTYLLIAFLLTVSYSFSQTIGAYKVVYSSDKNGKVTSGDIKTLIKEVKNGNPVRVGWSIFFKYPKTGKVVEMQHWTDAGFVTVIDGHVFAQVNGIFKQGPQIEPTPSVHLVTNTPNSWVGVISTSGMIRQKYDMKDFKEMLKSVGKTNEEIKKMIRKQEIINVPTKWAILVK
ncbi:MAG: hypothetical protein JXQ93_03695 [Flavobacteriaceae bacterium]